MTTSLPLPPRSLNLDELALLDAGGMGVVYSALWNKRKVAVKLPFRADPLLLKRFLREQKALAKLQHPNVVRMFQIGGPPEHDAPYILMEFMSRGSLRRHMERFRGPWEAANLVRPLVNALVYLRSNGYVHRDVKPENVLFDDEGRPKLSDMGLARPPTRFSHLTDTGQPLGTEDYASPEQLADAKSAEYSADIYSIGVLLHELITGTLISARGDARTSEATWRPELGGGIGQIVLGCVQSDPKRRYSAPQLLVALDAYLQGDWPSPPPLPRPAYPPMNLGRLSLGIVRIGAGGDGHTRYEFPDGIECVSRATEFEVPADVRQVTDRWLDQEVQKNLAQGIPFEDRPQPRIDELGMGFSDDPTEKLWPLRITIGRTSYFATQVTNRCIDFLLPSGRSIREAYAGSPDDVSISRLANPLAINLSVIAGDHIYVSQRGKYVGVNRVPDPNDPARVPAVSGTGHPDWDATDGNFDPFKAAIREATEEVLGAYDPTPEQITFFGVARTTGYFFPFLYGELRVNLAPLEYESQPSRHIHDVVGKRGRPFTIEEVVKWMKELYDQFDKNGNRRSLSHTAIFSLYQSLIYRFPNDIPRINRLLMT